MLVNLDCLNLQHSLPQIGNDCFPINYFCHYFFFFLSDSYKKEVFRLNRQECPDLYDITIKCENNREIKAHKCILVARMEYFRLMFSHNWSEVNFLLYIHKPKNIFSNSYFSPEQYGKFNIGSN